MLWIKALHIIFMVTWFAGLFYLPRLFVYHAETHDAISIARFKRMERKLYYGIMTPGACLTILSGGWLIVSLYGKVIPVWLVLKLILIALLILFHGYLGKLLTDFKQDRNRHSHVFYRWINEIPTVLLFAIVLLVVIKP